MPILLALLALFVLNARATDCGPGFDDRHPPALAAYATRVASGPAGRSWAETSPFDAALSHIQNLTSVPLSADYLALQLLKTDSMLDINRMQDNRLDQLVVKGTWIDSLEARPFGTSEKLRFSLYATLGTLRVIDGVLPAANFAYPDDFAREMRAWARDAGVRDPDAPGMLTQFLRLRVGLILKKMYDQLAYGDREALGMQAYRETTQLFDRALLGARRDESTVAFAKTVLNYDVREFGPPPVDVDHALRTLLQRLSAGRNVVMNMYWRQDRYDPRTASLALPGPSAEEERGLRAHGADLRMRAVVVDGYALDFLGRRPTWLLIKDSRGPGFGSEGHVHVRIDYLRFYLHSLEFLSPRH